MPNPQHYCEEAEPKASDSGVLSKTCRNQHEQRATDPGSSPSELQSPNLSTVISTSTAGRATGYPVLPGAGPSLFWQNAIHSSPDAQASQMRRERLAWSLGTLLEVISGWLKCPQACDAPLLVGESLHALCGEREKPRPL